MKLLNKFSSFDYIYKSGTATFSRFPFTLLSALLAAVVAIILVETDESFHKNIMYKLGMVATLGLPLFTALAVYADKKQWTKRTSLAFQSMGVALFAIYFISLPQDVHDIGHHLYRYFVLNICFHFFVAFFPFLGGNQIQGYWQYNKSLFLRFLTAALYSAVLYLGLSIAFASLDYLFGVDIDGEIYFELWIVIAGVFNTWVFLAGIPRNLNTLNHTTAYPNGLKIFTQYILLPLMALYFVILITYEAKIIVTWNLPKGWVSQLVLWYSVVGILSLLLLHPLREQTENKWIKVFSKWFFRALVPLVVMLFVAILARISDYGFTENRYYVLVMAVGLAVVVLYFIFSSKKDIRIIPIGIFAIALLSTYGPWSASSVSRNFQEERLEDLFVTNQLLVDGRFQDPLDGLSFESKKEMSSIITYLRDWHGLESFSRWLPDSVMQSLDTVYRHDQPIQIAEYFGFTYIRSRGRSETSKYFRMSINSLSAVPVFQSDYVLKIDMHMLFDSLNSFELDERTLNIIYDSNNVSLKLRLLDKSRVAVDSLSIMLVDRINGLITLDNRDNISPADMTVEQSGEMIDANIIFRSISGVAEENKPTITQFEALLFIRLKQ